MSVLIFIPMLTFFLLLAGERFAGRRTNLPAHGGWDWVIQLSGFVIQGAITPFLGYVIATWILPAWFPQAAGILPLGWWGAFLLNFVFVDFLYYWQHRWLHRVPVFWRMHRCHHSAKRLDVWVTSRNTLLLHFLFVYFLFNPVLGYLVSHPEAFFAGAMLTASLDLFRHANIDYSRLPGAKPMSDWLGLIFVLPGAHHLHHGAENHEGNYGANLIIWDRLFGTCLDRQDYPVSYGLAHAPPLAQQWLNPFKRSGPHAS